MSYELHNFNAGDTLYASDLNEMDEQILKNETDIASVIAELSDYKTSNDTEVSGLKSEFAEYLNGETPMSGDLTLQKFDNGKTVISKGHIASGGDYGTQIYDYDKDENFFALILRSNVSLSEKIRIVTGGNYYNILGTHNKPSGSYTGNGSDALRKIPTGGIGDVALIKGNGYITFMTVNGGGFSVNVSTGAIVPLGGSVLCTGGEIRIAHAHESVNKNGVTYEYDLL